jgi:iron complex transport system substrate-binding protein
MLYAIGAGSELVGDTDYCDYPPDAKSKAHVGGFRISYESVVALRPDLVVASDANRAAIGPLRSLHLSVFVIDPSSYQAVEQSLELLGHLSGREPGAAAVVARMEAARRAAARIAAGARTTPVVLPLIGANPLFAAGSGTFIADIVRLAGARDCVSAHGYVAYSREQAMADNPDFIMADSASRQVLLTDPALSTLAAVRGRRFFEVSDPDLIQRPGPRLALGLLEVARAVHGGYK